MARRSGSSTRDHSRPAARGRSAPARQSLQSRILSRVLVVTIAPMLFIAMIALVSLVGLSRSAERNVEASREELTQDVAGRAVRTDAAGVAREMERLLAERVADVIDLSASPAIVSAAQEAATNVGDGLVASPTAELEEQYEGPRRLERGSDAERHLRAIAKRQAVFRQLLFTERNGFTVGSSSKPEQFSNRDASWWSTAWEDGFAIGPVEQLGEKGYGLTVAARIGAQGTAERAGVLKAVVNLRTLQRTVDRIAQDSGSDVTVVTGDGQLLAETGSEHDASRILGPNIELDATRAEAVQRANDRGEPGFVLTDTSVVGFAPVSSVDGRLRQLLQRFDGLDQGPISWIAVVERSNDAAFAPLTGLSAVSEGLSGTARTFGIIVILALVGSLIAAFVVSTRLAQGIVRPLRSLGATARTIADDQLPVLVHHAQAPGGERATDLPMLPAVELRTNDEIEDVADAFNIVSSTAADLAADQARSRRNVSRMFVSLGRRNQNLLSRQLEFIDRLERDTSDPDLLDDLFRLDHLATRMRRNAESLLVLAGEEPARRWSEPVSLTAVVRGAISEVEDYRRVTLEGVDEAQLAGTAVGDVTHLLAELIENATQFSPPDTPVEIVGRRVVDGYALAVVDDGVGMSEEQLEDANRRIDASPMVDRVPSSFLGLFVVGRLAARHGIRVRLVESTTEGVTAKLLLPNALIDPPVPAGVAGDRDGARRPALADALYDEVDEHESTANASEADRAGVWVDVTDAAATDREQVPASVVRDRSPAFDQTAPPLPGRRGRTWSSEERSSSHGGAPFDRIEVRDLTDAEVDVRRPVVDSDAEVDVRRPVADSDAEIDLRADDRPPPVDDLGPDGGDLSTPPADDVDPGLDLRGVTDVRDDRHGGATDASGPADGGGFDEPTYTGAVRYPAVGDSAPTDAGAAQDTAVPDPAIVDDTYDDIWVPDDTSAPPADDVPVADPTEDDPLIEVARPLEDARPADGSDGEDDVPGDDGSSADDAAAKDGAPVDAEDDAPADDAGSVPVLEVQRRASQRDGGSLVPANGRPPAGRAQLRPEHSPAADDAAPPSQPSPMRTPAQATTNAEATDEHGVTLTAAERQARAARDRLSRFQQAVQQGRSQTRSRHNGGERHDA